MSTMNYYVFNGYLRNFDIFGRNMKILLLFENVSIMHSKIQGRKNAQKMHALLYSTSNISITKRNLSKIIFFKI